MRATHGRAMVEIGLSVGGAFLILAAWEVFTTGATNAIRTVNRGLLPANILWIASIVCFAVALLIYGTTPDPSSDELS